MAYKGKKLPKLKIPYYPGDDDKGHYEIDTLEEKIISEYTGYDFDRIEELEYLEYYQYLHDAAIYNLSQTKEGKEYLENCYRLEQTQPDRKRLREKMST